MTREGWNVCKLMVSTVHFRARKSRQNQQEEIDLEIEHDDRNTAWIGDVGRGQMWWVGQ